MKLYLDASAIVKLVKVEAESTALRTYLRRHGEDGRVTSALSDVEVVRAVSSAGLEAVAQARRQLARLDRIALDRASIADAGDLLPGSPLRSLDAIHLAAARSIGSELRSVVTYDVRMAEAAVSLGLSVEAPGVS